MHEDCLRYDILIKVYDRLGENNPEIVSEPVIEGEEKITSIAERESKDNGSPKLPLLIRPAESIVSSMAPTSKEIRKEPYRGLFEAIIQLNSGPTTWRIKDVRDNVQGSCKQWRERAQCLFCYTLLT